MFYVYALKRSDKPECPIFYIGKGTQDRPKQHLRMASRKVPSIKNKIIDKVLNDGGEITVEILSEFEDEQDAFKEEKRLISLYGRLDKGTGFLANHTDGGEGNAGRIWSDEERAAHSLKTAAYHASKEKREKTNDEIAKSKALKKDRNKRAYEKRISAKSKDEKAYKLSDERRAYLREAKRRSRQKALAKISHS